MGVSMALPSFPLRRKKAPAAVAASLVPPPPTPLEAAAQRARKLLHRRALVAAVASATPVPGLDWAVDAALLSRVLPLINAEVGLTPQQLDELSPHQREQVQKAVAVGGSMLIGKFITQDLVIKMVRSLGMRVATRQLVKYVPLAGQAVSAALGYTTLRYLGEQHIQDCIRVAQSAQLTLPAPVKK